MILDIVYTAQDNTEQIQGVRKSLILSGKLFIYLVNDVSPFRQIKMANIYELKITND